MSFPWKQSLVEDYSACKSQGQVLGEQTAPEPLRSAASGDFICAQLREHCISWLAFLVLRKDQWGKDQLKKDQWCPDKPLIHKRRGFAGRNGALPCSSGSGLILPVSYRLTWILPAINCQPCKHWVRRSPLLHRWTQAEQQGTKTEQGKIIDSHALCKGSPVLSEVGIPHMPL